MSERKSPPQDPAQESGTPSAAHQDAAAKGITRRRFLKGAGITAAGTALLEGVQVFNREAIAATHDEPHHGVTELGPGPVSVTLHVNGKQHILHIEPRTTLADVLRVQLGLTGTKVVCDRGSCSACTVLL